MTSTPGPAPAHARLAPLPPWRTVVFTVGCALAGLVLFAITFAVSFNEQSIGGIGGPGGAGDTSADVVIRNEGALVVVTLLDLLAGLVSIALLALYHRSRQRRAQGQLIGAPSFPLAVAIVALSAVSSFAVIGALYVMTVTARTRRGRDIAILAAVFLMAALISLTISTRILPGPTPNLALDVVGTGIVFVLIWLICTLIGVVRGGRDAAMAALAQEAEVARREHESMLRLRHAESQVLESRVAQARQAERAQITRELHDTLAHHLSLVSIHAGALEYRDDLTPEQTRQAAGAVAEAARSAGADLRVALGVLREGEVAPEPLPDLGDLAALLDQLPHGSAILLIRPPLSPTGLGDMSVAASRHLYRIVQECLTNARKHAPGECVYLTLSGEPGSGVVLEARNRHAKAAAADQASPAIPGSGLGLVGIAERTRLAGGGSRVEHGGGEFVLTAWVPWNA